MSIRRARTSADLPTEETRARVVALLFDIARSLDHFLVEAAAHEKLTRPQAVALLVLARPTSMGELAATLQRDPSNVTGIVDRLEARGLVERRAAPDDRRRRVIALTGKGEKLRVGLESRLHREAPGFDRLDDTALGTLQAALLRLAGAMGVAPVSFPGD